MFHKRTQTSYGNQFETSQGAWETGTGWQRGFTEFEKQVDFTKWEHLASNMSQSAWEFLWQLWSKNYVDRNAT